MTTSIAFHFHFSIVLVVAFDNVFELLVAKPYSCLIYFTQQFTGSPARTVGWRDPGFIHTSFLKDLWPNLVYSLLISH